jgi:hypothetical protein
MRTRPSALAAYRDIGTSRNLIQGLMGLAYAYKALIREGVARRTRAPLALAVLADPVFDKDDTRVAESRRAAARTASPSIERRSGTPASTEARATPTPLLRSVADAGLATDGRIPATGPHSSFRVNGSRAEAHRRPRAVSPNWQIFSTRAASAMRAGRSA